MKKLIKLKGAIVLLLLLFWQTAILAMAMQSEPGFDFGDVLVSFPTLVGATVLASEWIINKFNLVDNWAQVTSWGVGIVLVLLARYVFKAGFIMDSPNAIMVILNGLGVALASNGVFDVPFIQGILNALPFSKNEARSRAY